ncbi:MAG TPA: ribosome biogenesis GTP-binding protein YihA/YsxC [Gammaproteobacteria bacterium]|nr:ribosome biogenesis GTP-binding protein YihA/YsxC [Gammaproteobacteria bacterium]
MSILNYNQIVFLKSANSKAGLPNDSGAEVAFGGRSNAGKSSALNKITGIHRLARTSKTPGRTQLINFFQLADPEKRLVDLPGYGYAKVPDSIKKHWQTIVSQYLTERKSLKGLILLMDIRHPLKSQDWQMIEWSVAHQLPTHVLLTKADKLGKGAARNTLLMLKKELLGYEEFISSQLFSVLSGEGIVQVQEKLDEWLL